MYIKERREEKAWIMEGRKDARKEGRKEWGEGNNMHGAWKEGGEKEGKRKEGTSIHLLLHILWWISP